MMDSKARLRLKIFLVFAALLAAGALSLRSSFWGGDGGLGPASSSQPQRIVSITPAGTEILFDLGLGDRVVAVTKYCEWPPEALEKIRLPEMMSLNMESLTALSPDLIVLSNMNATLSERLEKMGFRYVLVGQDNFAEICAAMLKVGEICGVSERAQNRVAELEKAVQEIRVASGDLHRAADDREGSKPRVLVCVGRDPSDSVMASVYSAGSSSFYQDLLDAAGAQNALDTPASYLRLSREGLLRTNPDIVIELIGVAGMGGKASLQEILAPWQKMADLRAAQDGNIAVIRGDFTLRAGPRYPLILQAFIAAIHEGAREQIGE